MQRTRSFCIPIKTNPYPATPYSRTYLPPSLRSLCPRLVWTSVIEHVYATRLQLNAILCALSKLYHLRASQVSYSPPSSVIRVSFAHLPGKSSFGLKIQTLRFHYIQSISNEKPEVRMNGQASMQAIKKSAAVWCILLCKAHTAPFSRHSTYKDLPTHFFL